MNVPVTVLVGLSIVVGAGIESLRADATGANVDYSAYTLPCVLIALGIAAFAGVVAYVWKAWRS